LSGIAVGHVPAADAVSVAEHAASVMTNDAVQATSATIEDTREEFTDVTLQAHRALPSPRLVPSVNVQALFDLAGLASGQTVLVNGPGGAVGG